MPYVFYDEVPEGLEEADVVERGAYDSIVAERDNLQHEYDEMSGARDTLAAELDDAKKKFANAFLSSPQHAKKVQAGEMRSEESKPKTFKSLFSERNSYNAN